MKAFRLVLLMVAICTLASCKLRIIVPQGGSVDTESGAYDCPTATSCDIDVVDFFFNETFVAKPANGYTFRFWRKGDKRFCGRKRGKCQLTTEGLDGSEDLAAVMQSFFQSDEVFYLQPVFRSTGSITTPLTSDNVQGRWVGEAEITSPALPDLACRWNLTVNIEGSVASIFANLNFDNTPIDCETFQARGNVSFSNGGAVMIVNINVNSSSLLGPSLLEFIVDESGLLVSESEFKFDGVDIVQSVTFQRP